MDAFHQQGRNLDCKLTTLANAKRLSKGARLIIEAEYTQKLNSLAAVILYLDPNPFWHSKQLVREVYAIFLGFYQNLTIGLPRLYIYHP